MADYTYGQLEDLWIKAGGSKALAPLMAAIALAESSGNPDAQNPSGATGLWQILGAVNPADQDQLTNPQVNAKEAVLKYKTQGLNAWTTYTSGAYQQFYQGSTPASSLPQGGTGVQQATLDSSITPGDLQWLEGPQGIMQAISGLFSGLGTGAISDTEGIGKALTLIASEFGNLIAAFEWWFVPSHIVRAWAFLIGLVLFLFGVPGLMKAGGGNEGDAGLAISIMFITLAGVAWFIAFHNLPTDVDSLETLLGWIKTSISEGRPAGSATETAQLA